MPEAHAYRLSATLWKRALCLDPLPAYITWNTQKGWMELCPDSGHQSICSLGWLTGTYICLWRRESRRRGAISVSSHVSGGKQWIKVGSVIFWAATAAFIPNALYLKVRSSCEKCNVFLKHLLEWSTYRYIFFFPVMKAGFGGNVVIWSPISPSLYSSSRSTICPGRVKRLRLVNRR